MTLYIPLKQSKPINLYEELSEAIRKDYFQAVSTFEGDLQHIAKLRNEISALQDENSTLDALIEYFPLLLAVKNKFPPDCVSFGWYQSLGYGFGGPQNSHSFSFEQANVAYQIAAVHSQLGWKESRYTDEGLRRACTHFQAAAGTLEYLETMEGEKPNDLSSTTLLSLKYLMLAQAQETIWQKAILNGAKDSVVARLSKEAERLYLQALQHGNKSDYIKLEWINHMGAKRAQFGAAAHYRMALVFQNSAKYGPQVASLREASRILSECKNTKYVDPKVMEELRVLSETVQEACRTAEKDNDLLYFQEVPKPDDIAPAPMVKPIIPTELHPTHKSDIFKDLLPYIVVQAAQAFTERKMEYVQQQFHVPVDTLNAALTQFLADSHLVSALDAIQQPENLPASIEKHSQEIAAAGGVQFIEETIAEVGRCASQAQAIVDGCRERLRLEQHENTFFQGSRTPSKEAAKALHDKIDKMAAYLAHAQKGDRVVLEKFSQIKPVLAMYVDPTALCQYIPHSQHISLNEKAQEVATELRTSLGKVQALRDKRTDFLYNVDHRARDNPILPEVVGEYRTKHAAFHVSQSTFEPIYEAHIARVFRSDIPWLQASREEQVQLQRELEQLQSRFQEERGKIRAESQEKRQAVLQSLEQAYVKYVDLVSNLKEGSKFYNDFFAKGNDVLRECEEFLHERRMEARRGGVLSDDVKVELMNPRPRYV